ncbi:MAG: hypothetical protein IJR72_00665 [Oscillospiraceae bacterium]|nr:hypothetical protein [Oscillospiraceae bacterium]
MAERKTKILMDEIERCDNPEDYNQLVDEHSALYVGWGEHICSLLYERGKTVKDIMRGCGISKSGAEQFLRVIPTKRDNVIMTAMILGLDLDETNELLTRWAKFQKLYAKNPLDAIWIYLIERGGAEAATNPAELFEAYKTRYNRLHKAYLKEHGYTPDDEIPDTRIAFDIIEEAVAKSSANSAARDQNFTRFMKQLLPAFDAGYQKLIDYIESLFRNIEKEDDEALGIVIEKDPERDGKIRSVSPNEAFDGYGSWKTAYFRRIQKLKKEREVPERVFLIALGFHMRQTLEEINHLLELAGMAPLCARDHLEGAIAFHLGYLYRGLPDEFPAAYLPELYRQNETAEEVTPPSSLREYLDEDGFLPEGLRGYFRLQLEEMDISDHDGKKAAKKLWKWLGLT